MWPGFKSRRRRHMWVEFVVGSLLCSERFFSGYSSFLLSSKTNISKFQFDQESGRRRTTMWMCYLQIVIYFLFLFYLLLYKVVPESCLAGKIFLTLVERRIWVLPSLVWTFCTVAPPCFDWQAFWLHSCFLPSIRIVESCLTSTVSFDCCCCCWMERTTVFCPCSPIFAKSLWKPTGKKD